MPQPNSSVSVVGGLLGGPPAARIGREKKRGSRAPGASVEKDPRTRVRGGGWGKVVNRGAPPGWSRRERCGGRLGGAGNSL
ncbi:hypothetical protein NDU88_008152 [Pleurodeles waltl]|uniref:Uncharacterized protein n=1 Tax=Pleurodeles waltl TaxID=8319 RepID=A0AAV7RUD1_PLEWA|nr:hypothetical protein NDU88_008152 [Pleurodeles waltl]